LTKLPLGEKLLNKSSLTIYTELTGNFIDKLR